MTAPPDPRAAPDPHGTAHPGAAHLRIATWNVEWFDALFDDDGRMLEDAEPSRRFGVSRADQLAAIGIVMTAINADALLVVEAPNQGRKRSTVRALETFAAACGLRTTRALIGFPSPTEQELALLFDPAVLTALHDPQGEATGKKGAYDAPRFDGVFRIDLDLDGVEDTIVFARPPLELLVTPARGAPFRMIGVHTKSKAPHGARSPDEVTRLGIENRRKLLAQCHWLRRRVLGHLAAADPLIVLGDMNDGPGLDEYEHLFGRSGVEVVMGLGDPPPLRLHDPNARKAFRRSPGLMPSSARFYMEDEDRFFPALLDYIMVSPDIAARCPRWRIWHPFDDPACWGVVELRDALLTASDHFPVTLDLPL